MNNISNLEELENFINSFKELHMDKNPLAWGIARVKEYKGQVINVTYLSTNYKSDFITSNIILWALKEFNKDISPKDQMVFELNKDLVKKILDPFDYYISANEILPHKDKNLKALLEVYKVLESDKEAKFKVCFLFSDQGEIQSPEIAYLKLYLLSNKDVNIRNINLDGIFKILPNVAWDYQNNAYSLEYLKEFEIELKARDKFPCIAYVDKFPRMLSHIVVDESIRILDSSKVRLGAHIANKTTIMPGAAYVNFNAGTLGAAMIEGRVSSSVIIGEGTDVGGGASILGVLSGTNGNPISIGKRCLLGANSVTGIPLGDDCIIDAGIAILEGTKVYLSHSESEKLKSVNKNFSFDKELYKAIELSGLNGLHFRQDSQSGKIMLFMSKRAIKLNKDLH